MPAVVGGTSAPTPSAVGGAECAASGPTPSAVDAADAHTADPARKRKLTTAALIGIIGAAVALRMLGITWGLPGETHLFSYHPDEYFSLGAAFSLLNSDPNPHFFNYPSLYLYVVAAACNIAHGGLAMGADVSQLPEILRAWTLDARLVTVALSVLTVWAVYAAGSRIAGRRAGLLAAAVLAVLPGHVLYSHFAAVDVALTLLTTLSFLAALYLLEEAPLKTALLAGLAVGAAAATKYNGALALLMPLMALGIRFRRAERPARAGIVKQALVVAAVAALTFCICSPYVLLDWDTASQHIAFERRHMVEGEYPAQAADPCGWFFHTRALAYAVGGSVVLLGLVALGIGGCARNAWPMVPATLFALLWFLMIGATGVRYARYGIPLLPLLAVAAGLGLAEWQRARRGWASHLAALAVLGGPLATSALLSGSMAFEVEPRDAALAEIERRVPEDDLIVLGRAVWFDMPPLDFNNGGEVLGRHPVWGAFRESRWQLQPVSGFRMGPLETLDPRWYVTSSFQLDEFLRAGNHRATEFHELLQADFTPTRFPRRWGWLTLGPCGPLPHDWSYPFSTVTVWELRRPEDSPPTRGN